MNRNDIIELSNKVHNFYYDYSKIVETKMLDKIKIRCSVHGEFEQRLYNHLNGSGCKKCADDFLKLNRRKSQEKFIEDATKIHNIKYDYSLVCYINSKNKIKIVCPVHGEFEQQPSKHLMGDGYKKCADDLLKDKRKKSKEQFIEDANKVHKHRYNYSLVEYINNQTKIKIICTIHGVFEQIPNNHLRGEGCNFCANIKNRLRYIETLKKRFEENVQIMPNFSIVACEFFDKIMIEKRCHIQHAMNGGEFYVSELGLFDLKKSSGGNSGLFFIYI